MQEGTDGIETSQGKYTWVKYSTCNVIEDIRTSADITDDPEGANYIGIAYNQEEQTESINPNAYTWSRIYDENCRTELDNFTILVDNETVAFAIDKDYVVTHDQNVNINILAYRDLEPVTNFTILKKQIICPEELNCRVDDASKSITLSCKKGTKVKISHGSVLVPIQIENVNVVKKIGYTFNYLNTDSYTWIMYADDSRPLPEEMDPNPEGHTWIGIGRDKKSPTPSDNYHDYEWREMGTAGTGVNIIQEIYHSSYYDQVKDIPVPTASYKGLNFEEGLLNLALGSVVLEGTQWSTEKPDQEPGKHLWTSLMVILDDGTAVFTDPVMSSEWEMTIKIGGRQLIRHSKTLIDERIYWFGE